MSSASSYSSELTRSSSSISDVVEVEACLNSESPTTADPIPRAESTLCSLSLSGSNENSNSECSAKSTLPTAALGGDGLLPKERIHRYIDQCVPTALIEHQRATDGRVLVQLCEELVQFGGPDAWAARLPSNFFCGSVHDARDAPIGSFGESADACRVPACLSDGVLYFSEDVPATWEADKQGCRGDGDSSSGGGVSSTLPAGKVSWDSLTRHLHQLVTRLNHLITREGGYFPCYTLPFRMQARVTPMLYAWATHWPLIEANVCCWEVVVKAFHAACGAHKPAKDTSSSLSDFTVTAVSQPSVDSTKSEAGAAAAGATERAHTGVRYTFILPWKPLASLFQAVLEPANARLLAWSAVVAAVRRELPGLCRRASPFFSRDAVDGLWGLVCSDLQRASRGVSALSLFVQLVPYRHLSASPSEQSLDGAENGSNDDDWNDVSGGALPPQLTTRAVHILRFLLIEAAAWSPPMPPNPPIVPRSKPQKRGHKGQRLLMPWHTAVMFFVGSLARAHPAVSGLEDYAEPLFTAWLNALALPIGSSACMTGATAAAAASWVVRAASATGGMSPSTGFDGNRGSGTGQRGAGEAKSSQLEWTATPFVRLLNAFPDNTESPLWRQLERWIHVTSVLVRLALPCKPGSAAERVCECYCRLAREALRRVPRGKVAVKRLGRRQDNIRGDVSTATSSATRASPLLLTSMPPRPQSTRYWSSSTIDKFVQLFLPLAVSAFLTRAKTSTDFLICLLYMSPAIALPALLKCVDTGLYSPTEVAAQRRASAVLLMHTIITLFTDDEHLPSGVAQVARETVANYFQNCAMLLLSLVSPSTPEVAHAVLTLLGVAVSYIPDPMILRSVYEAEAFGTECATRVIALYTERGVDRDRTHGALEKHIEALITALPPNALAMVVRAALRESQNRDYGSRMCALVSVIAMVAPAEAWRCAEQTWLPVLLDPAAGDGEVEWASALLGACVSELGDRLLLRTHAADVAAAVRAQLRFITSKLRRRVSVHLASALVASLMRPRWSAETTVFAQKRRERAGAASRLEDNSPLPAPAHATASKTAAAETVAARIGMATEVRVSVEEPAADADVRAAADLFNDALRDIVEVVTHASQIRVCSPTAAAAVNASTLAGRFLVSTAGMPSSLSPGLAAASCASESASAVNTRSVLEGTLEWLLRLLEVFEWLYAEPSPSFAKLAAVATARSGVHWSDINPRSAWKPARSLPRCCHPAYSRAELFEIIYTHLCLPLLEYHVLAPLQKVGVDLRPMLRSLVPELELAKPTTSATITSTRLNWTSGGRGKDGVVDWNCVSGLLRWLVLSRIDCPQHLWVSPGTLFYFWSRLSSNNPSCRSRKKLPLSGWASRALQLHVEAAVAGYLPVPQVTLSRTLTVLQCLTFSPHEAVRSSSLHFLMSDKLIFSLDATSFVRFVQRQLALSAVVLAQSRAVIMQDVQATEGEEEDEDKESSEGTARLRSVPASALATSLLSPPGGSDETTDAVMRRRSAQNAGLATPAPSDASTVRTLRLHTLQESSSGTLFLIAMMTIQNHFSKAPWCGLQAWWWLMTFPEQLRTISTARLLPLIQKTYDMQTPVSTTTSRSPQYVEAVVQLASSLVAAHPTRAAVLLTLANRLYWPSPQRWLSLHVLRLLVRLSASVHVEVRSRATELLSAVAVHVSVREAQVPVYLMGDPLSVSSVQVPPSFLLSESGIRELSEDDRQIHDAAMRTLRTSLQQLAEVLPMLPQYLSGRGQVFPLCVVTVPQSAALAAGLPLLPREALTAPQSSFMETPSFMDALAAASPPDTQSFRRQWSELLLSTQRRTAGTEGGSATFLSSSPPLPPQQQQRKQQEERQKPMSNSASPESSSTSPSETGKETSWALHLLTLPIERPLAGVVQEASPTSLINLLASVHDGTPASAQRVTELLAWAEDRLQGWEVAHALHRFSRHTSSRNTTDAQEADVEAVEGDDSCSAGLRSLEEDEMYRLFFSVLVVAAAVVQLSAQDLTEKKSGKADRGASLTALRARALQLLKSLLTCLGDHAEVPHLVMRSIMLLGITAVRSFISVEETWTIIVGVAEELRPSSVEKGETRQVVGGDKNGNGDGNSDGDRNRDTWSQRHLRLITVILALVQAVPLTVTAALLPRLVNLVGEHGRTYFMSPADQVRQCTSRLISCLITIGSMQSETLVEYSQCYPAARRLLATLLDRVNVQVFQGKLPFTSAQSQNGTATTSAPPSLAAAAANAPAASLFASLSTEDVALLTTTALCVQLIPIDIFLDFSDDLLMLLCYCLDLSFTKVQHLHEATETALHALVTSWMPKAHAHGLLVHLCAICTGTVSYGVSRRAKAACTRALCFVVFRNLHRIGKFAMMLRIGDAALAALSHRDASVRGEGSRLFAILTKVASESQMRVIAQTLGTECRQLSKQNAALSRVQAASAQLSEAATTSSSVSATDEALQPTKNSIGADLARNRRIAVVQALGAIMLADPGTPSSYVPKLMEVLVSCAREGNTECGNFAKGVFEQWWFTHREGWEREYKKYFTSEQVDAMTDLLLAPRYYA